MTARARMPLKIPLVVSMLATCAFAQELHERQVLQLFRESPYYLQLQAEVDIVRVEAQRHGIYPNPSVSATFEGAGRTDFFVLEQELMLNGRRTLLRQAGNSTVRVAEAVAEHALHQGEARVRRAFFQLIYSQMKKEAIDLSVGELEQLIRQLRDREEAGEGSKFDRLRAEREVVERKIESAEADAVVVEMRAVLAGLLGERVNPDALAVRGTLDPGFDLPALSQALLDGLAARSDYKVESERLEQLRL
ncbi:MAG: TolC family protein, partial [Bryobacterales bacterium]|nr:TolC family protein [Bryobacterales bacterium]